MIDLASIQCREDSLDRLFKLVKKNEQFARFATLPQEHILGRQVQQKVSQLARAMGYRVWPTPHKNPFDLWIENCRVEVKGSRWQQAGRYQAQVRNHKADVIIFDAVNGTDYFFIIPMRLVTPRHTIEITRYDVQTYSGRWAEFLEAWSLLEQAIDQAEPRPIQLSYLEV
jgi:hypothetical protein